MILYSIRPYPGIVLLFEHTTGWLNDPEIDEITLSYDSGNKVDSIFYGTGGQIKSPLIGTSRRFNFWQLGYESRSYKGR